MSYTYDLRPEASFEDRYSQFIAFGIPKADVDTLRATIKNMWADAPGGNVSSRTIARTIAQVTFR